jgi:hypothetical protein
MRLFFICPRVPFPPDRRDKITTFNEIRHLSTKHEVPPTASRISIIFPACVAMHRPLRRCR